MLCCENTSVIETVSTSQYDWVEIHSLLCLWLRNSTKDTEQNLANMQIIALMTLELIDDTPGGKPNRFGCIDLSRNSGFWLGSSSLLREKH